MSESNDQKVNSWQIKDGETIPLGDIRAVYLSENDMAAIALEDGSTRLTHIPFGKAVQQLGVFNEDQSISNAWQGNIAFAYSLVYLFLIVAFIWGIYSFIYVGVFDLTLRILPLVIIFGFTFSQRNQWKQARLTRAISTDKNEWNRATALFHLNSQILFCASLFGLLVVFPLGDPVTNLIAVIALIAFALFWLFRLNREKADLKKFNEEKFMQANFDKEQLPLVGEN